MGGGTQARVQQILAGAQKDIVVEMSVSAAPPFHAGTIFLSGGAPVTVTLPNPVNPDEDGKCLRFVAQSAQPHIINGAFISAANGAISSLVMDGSAGAFVELIARVGFWFVRAVGGNSTIASRGFKRVVLNLSSVDILALNVTPIQILPAPGAGKTYIGHEGQIIYYAGGVPYTIAGGSFIGYVFALGGTSFWIEYVDNLITLATSAVKQGFAGGTAIDLTVATNAALLVQLTSAATLGNGTVRLILDYSVVDV
jgi:hypothetical protein